ncbi:MAG: hypothetical protein EOS05_10310 [Mesorhizobium sp.]|nr:MAG: hypothetical protein EOS05_10310 [Mesorhizobium sp.]
MTASPSSIESAARLRRIATCAREGRPIDPADGHPFADGVDSFFAGMASLDQALGLNAAGRGKSDAKRALLTAERDEALRQLAAHFGTETSGANAEGVHDVHDCLTEFERWRWPDLRGAAVCPPDLSGADALAWTILRGMGGKVWKRRSLADFYRE